MSAVAEVMVQRGEERRKVLWAVLASILVHLIVAYSLAAFGTRSAAPVLEEDKPVELTVMDLATAPPVVPKNPPFLETEKSKESAEKPKEQTFESNANSIAASNAATATGEAPMPAQEGKDRPFMNLDTRELSLPSEGAQPQPQQAQTTPQQQQPTPAPKPQPVATPLPEEFAMLTSTPTPPPKAPEQVEAEFAAQQQPTPQPSQRPASSFQAQREQTRISGRITNRGPSSVNAVGTPLGHYQKQVSDAIGSRWYYYMKNKIDLVSVGTAHIGAEVDHEGHVQNLQVLSNNANEAFANICLQSFLEAKLPPIPPDLVAALPGGRMPVDFYFTTYSN
jgi:outer membrane biosynthesis protein TonB